VSAASCVAGKCRAQRCRARQIAEFAGWQFNLGNNTLTSPAGEEQVLSTSESELLKVFVSNPNRILQREQLMGTRDLSPTDRSIDVRISRLRRKLEPDADSPAFIKTVYGAGYLFLATVTWPINKPRHRIGRRIGVSERSGEAQSPKVRCQGKSCS
jgi:DNA-binding response OmpR family regulator